MGRLDILLEVSPSSAFSTAPREGHLEAVYYLFASLRRHNSAAINYDPTMSDSGENSFIGKSSMILSPNMF